MRMKTRILGLLLSLGLCCASVKAQSVPNVTTYPSTDSNWTLTGNVQPISCFGGACTFNLAANTGLATSANWDHTVGSVWEPQTNELFQVQANAQPSFGSYLWNNPVTATYKIAVQVQGQLGPPIGGGNNVYPIMEISVNGSKIPICKYPNINTITQTSDLLVNNGGHTDGNGTPLFEYAESCALTISAGNNTIGVQINGGHGNGGLLAVRNMVIFRNAIGIIAYIGCQAATWQSFHVSGVDLEAIVTNATATGRGTNGCSNLQPLYINLGAANVVSTGCSGVTCRLLDID